MGTLKFSSGRRSVVRLPVLAAAGMAAVSASAQSPKRGGSLSISTESDLQGLDPLVMSSINDKQGGLAVFDTLLDIDPKGNLIPNLAEKFEAAPDATWFRINLRPNVKFHDETPLDAQAVVEHFKRLMDPKMRYRFAAELATVGSIEATAPLEVLFKMKSPAAHFPAQLADFTGMVVSPAAVKRLGDEFRNNPVGSGPFVFKEWRRGSQIVFTRNSSYWRGPVHLDEVVLRPLPDEQTRIASLKAGNLDIAMNAPSKDVVDAKSNKKIVIHDPGSLATVFVMINTGEADVSDVRVRQAMAHALDRDAWNKALNKGLLKVANTPFGTGHAAHEQVEGYPKYDPARAKKLLAEYGKPVKLKFSISSAPQSNLTAQVLQQMWKKVGIECEITPHEQVQLIRNALNKQYQIMLFRWQGGIDPDRNVYNFFHSKGSANRTAYNNPEMDRLLDAGRTTMNPEERLKIYKQVNNLLARDLPYLFMSYFNNYSLMGTNIKGVTRVPDGMIRVRDVWKER